MDQHQGGLAPFGDHRQGDYRFAGAGARLQHPEVVAHYGVDGLLLVGA